MRRCEKIVMAVLLAFVFGTAAQADPVSGTLYYTIFSGAPNVNKINFNYDGASTFTLSGNAAVATTFGADGLLFAPDGNLIVAGQNSGQLHEVTPGGGAVNTVFAGNTSFHLALSSNASNALLYSIWNANGGPQIAATQLSGGGLSGPGVAYVTSCPTGCSTDVRGIIFDPNNGTWYYGTAGDGSVSGTFGTVAFDNTLHTATLTELLSGVPAHGLTFDPLTGDIIFSSGDMAEQFDPSSGTVVSTLTIGGQVWDQSAVDGKGHLFLASNGGSLTFADYKASGLIGAGGNFDSTNFLAGSLDDIAPLSGIGGSTGVPEPTSIMLLGTAFLGLAALRKRARRA